MTSTLDNNIGPNSWFAVIRMLPFLTNIFCAYHLLVSACSEYLSSCAAWLYELIGTASKEFSAESI